MLRRNADFTGMCALSLKNIAPWASHATVSGRRDGAPGPVLPFYFMRIDNFILLACRIGKHSPFSYGHCAATQKKRRRAASASRRFDVEGA
jgi:hypothetical protein